MEDKISGECIATQQSKGMGDKLTSSPFKKETQQQEHQRLFDFQ